MITLPQRNFRGQDLTFEEFCDLVIIGMAGHTDHLIRSRHSYTKDGMVNYSIVADGLGLKYESGWLEGLADILYNLSETIATHDTAPFGEDDDGFWVYLDGGFSKIAELLYEKYYIPSASKELSYQEFSDYLLVILGCHYSDNVDQDGNDVPDGEAAYFDLKRLADSSAKPYENDWIDKISADWLAHGYIEEKVSSEATARGQISLTYEGFLRSDDLSNSYGAEGWGLLDEGAAELYFSVDASHISRLGLELVAKQETAVAELVKNGFDADATVTELIFGIDDPKNTYLDVLDNGIGMNLSQLEDGFMRLSTRNKVNAPKSQKFGRQKAGRKGIGRFAAQRLGHTLTLTTTTEEMNYALRLDINWDLFEGAKDLASIPSSLTRIEKPFDHGTQLIIGKLRDTWTSSQIAKSYQHISELIQPFPLSKVVKDSNVDPGFIATFAKESKGDLDIVADDWKSYFKHALAIVRGSVDGNGRASWSVQSQRFGVEEHNKPIGPDRENPAITYSNLKNVRFEAYYYIDKELQRGVKGNLTAKLAASGGIRLYRNGFRVLPYGERYDDWLKLNVSNNMRKVLAPHSNRNFLGFVEIDDVDGSFFEETSSREGLLENDSFDELKDFVSSALKTAILPIAEARDKRKTTTETRRQQRSPQGQATEIVARLETLKQNAPNDPEYAGALARVINSVSASIEEIGQSGQMLIEELEMMRVLGSMGLAIGEFTHEVRLSLEAAKATVSLSSGNPSMESAILENLANFEGYLAYFDATIRNNVTRELVVMEIRDVVNSFLKALSSKLDRREISIETNYQGTSLFLRPMHKSEWASILINLYTNSLKAIRRAGVKGKIRISCGRENGSVFLDFLDNGDGIPSQNSARIFEPFFTTTAALGTKGEDETLLGMGLGLKIVKDIVEGADGAIQLQPPHEGFSTRLRVSIPEAKSEDIPADAY